MHEEQFNAMRQSIVDGAPESARESANQALALGIAPLDAINKGFVAGLNSIGEQFNRGEVFLPDLVMAGEAMKAAPPNPMIAMPVAIPGRSGNHLISVETGEM